MDALISLQEAVSRARWSVAAQVDVVAGFLVSVGQSDQARAYLEFCANAVDAPSVEHLAPAARLGAFLQFVAAQSNHLDFASYVQRRSEMRLALV